MDEKNETIQYETKIKIAPLSIKKLNPQFSLCDILVCYHGDNRKKISLSKEVIEKNLYSIYGIPIVGEWVYKLDGTNKKSWGSHGDKIIKNRKGAHFERTTKPYGFVTKEAAETASWITVTEKDGHTLSEYLKLEGCVLWTDRFEEAISILDKNYGQSMEIEIKQGHYRYDQYYEVEEFVFSALCVLGTEYEPCFESARIIGHTDGGMFKQEFSLMLSEYENYMISLNSNKTKKGDEKMNKEKIQSLLSAFKFTDKHEKETNKYTLLGELSKNKITVIDKEDDFKIYSVDYACDDSENIVIDWDSKTEMTFTAVEKTENSDMSLIDTINKFAESKSETITEELTKTFNIKIDEMAENYESLSKELDEANIKLKSFEEEKKEREKKAHKQEIDNIIKRYASKIGRYPKFLVYKAKIDYSKSTEDIERELSLMAGQAVMEDNKKVSFSYTPVETEVNFGNSNQPKSKYGNLLDKYMK